MQTMHITKPRRPEEQQLRYGPPTSTRQRTRVTTTAAELRRWTTKEKPQSSRASSQHGKRKGRTQGKAQEKTGARTIQQPEMGVEEEAKASGKCDRASEETKTRSRRRSHQRVTKNHPNSRKRRWTNRHRKRMKNHEGQPKPPS